MRRFSQSHANVACWLHSLRFINVAPTLSANDAIAPTRSVVSPLGHFYPTPSRCAALLQKRNGVKTALFPTGAMQMRGFHAALEQQQEMNEEAATGKRRMRTARGYFHRMQLELRERRYHRVVRLFKEMKSQNMPYHNGVYTSMLKAYSRLNNIHMVKHIFNEIVESGTKLDKHHFNTLIYAYSINGDIEAAFEALHKMEDECEIGGDLVTYRALITVCSKGKDVDRARKTFDDMMEKFEEKDVRSFNAMMKAYTENADSDTGEAYLQACKDLLVMLKENEMKPEAFTYIPLVKLCDKMGLREEMMEYLKECISNDVELTLFTFDVLFGTMEDLEMTDEELEAHLLLCFKRMNELDMKPSGITFKRFLDLYEKRGDLSKAFGFFTKLTEEDMAHVSDSATGVSAQIVAVDRLYETNVYSEEEALTKLDEVLENLKSSGTSLTYHGHRTWLAICIRASDVKRAFDCWNSFISGNHRSTTGIAESMIRLTLDHDRVDDAVEMLKFVQKAKKIPMLKSTYEAILAYCVEKSDKKNAKKTYEYMQKAKVKPTEAIQAHLDTLQLV